MYKYENLGYKLDATIINGKINLSLDERGKKWWNEYGEKLSNPTPPGRIWFLRKENNQPL